MKNVQMALSLSLIAQKNIAIHTNDVANCIKDLRRTIIENFEMHDVVEIDLLRYQDDIYNQVTRRMVKTEEGEFPKLHEVVIWKNLDVLNMDVALKTSVIRIFDELDQYNNLALRNKAPTDPIKFGEYQVVKPEMHLVIPVLDVNHRLPQIYQHIKNRFWFSQSCFIGADTSFSSDKMKEEIIKSRLRLDSVFAKPSIQEYICSLLVFTRSHRLCSLAPLTTRPSFSALEDIMTLAKCLAIWENRDNDSPLFVTPDYVKVAYRKIGYWLVDWETNRLFKLKEYGAEYRKRMEISILTGDWYGSEWNLVEEYLQRYESKLDWNSSSGFSNAIVDEVLQLVRPPI